MFSISYQLIVLDTYVHKFTTFINNNILPSNNKNPNF